MKIRMKRNHMQVKEVDIDYSQPRFPWCQRGALDGELVFFDREEWEPVPEEKWEDVTVECEYRSGVFVHTPNVFTGGCRACTPENGYRISKALVRNNYSEGYAFIVEKRVS